MRWTRFASVLLACTATSACNDSTGLDFSPILTTDTVLVAAPLPGNEHLPTALDITGSGGGSIGGGRFPERPSHALRWDFFVNVVDGQLVLIPQRGLGVESPAALTQAVAGETFESLREAPGQSTFTRDSAIVMLPGRVYVARSRDVSGFCFGRQFAKLSPLKVDVAAGLLELQITTNERCEDPRLAPE